MIETQRWRIYNFPLFNESLDKFLSILIMSVKNKLSTAICSTSDWLLFNDSCFKAFEKEINWFKAQQNCRILNSSLTSIHSDKKTEFVRTRSSGRVSCECMDRTYQLGKRESCLRMGLWI